MQYFWIKEHQSGPWKLAVKLVSGWTIFDGVSAYRVGLTPNIHIGPEIMEPKGEHDAN